jgi:hypothetical protein
LAFTLDQRVTQAFDQRKDPVLAEQYRATVMSIDALRLQATSYSFTNTGFWASFGQMLMPTVAYRDHWNQMVGTNAYAGDGGSNGLNHALAKLQQAIEAFRGAAHLVGDFAGMLSSWGSIAALAGGAMVLTGVLAKPGAVIAAIGVLVADVGAIVKLILDAVDLVLGLVQIALIIARARNTSDPVERARLVGLLKKECGDLAQNITGLVVQAATIALTAGTAAGVSRAFGKSTSSVFKRELLDQTVGAAKHAGNLRKVIASMKMTTKGTNVAGKTADIAIEAGTVAIRKTIRSGKNRNVTFTRIDKFTSFPRYKAKHQAEVIAVKRECAKIASIEFVNGPIINTLGNKSQAESKRADVKQPQDPADVKKVDDNGALSTVAMWPSQIAEFERAKAPLADARARMMTQYEFARWELEEIKAAKVEETMGKVIDANGQIRFTAIQKQNEALAGEQTAQQGVENSNQVGTTQQQMKDQTGQVDGKVDQMQSQADGLEVPPQPAEEQGWMDYLTQAPMAFIGDVIKKAQDFIAQTAMQWMTSAAGFTKEELDAAGIEDSYRADAMKEKKSQTDAKETEQKTSEVQRQAYALMQNATAREQQGIQGMIDAQQFLSALDQAEADLNELITEGNAYIAKAQEILQHEQSTQLEHKGIDAAYVAPLVNACAGFSEAIKNGGKDTASAATSRAKGVLAQMKEAYPDLDVGRGNARIDSDALDFTNAYIDVECAFVIEASNIRAGAQKLVGTKDYAAVTALAADYDDMVTRFEKSEDALNEWLANAMANVLGVYRRHIDGVVKAAQSAQQDPQQQPEEPKQ